ncbi:hypothetical protein T492DRAFT_886527 [Pavlovales sp. CCMP2436]|nr:hypothetical protein T492DRAFT_886527 [Pavlovales sp. CCMP2436]
MGNSSGVCSTEPREAPAAAQPTLHRPQGQSAAEPSGSTAEYALNFSRENETNSIERREWAGRHSVESVDSTHEGEAISMSGVSLQLLRLLRARAEELRSSGGPPRAHRTWENPPSRRMAGEALTTEDVSLEIIKPATAPMGCSYAHLLAGAHAHLAPMGDRRDVGRANVFVSHAWAYKFADLVGAIESAAAELIAAGRPGGKEGGRKARRASGSGRPALNNESEIFWYL